MPDDQTTLPAASELPSGPTLPTMVGSTMSPALQIMLDERLFSRCMDLARFMSKAKGFVPPHLLDCPQSCFAIVTRAITWKLDPFAVAQSTYETPGGKVGYEGKLCQAILENSGRLVGPVTYKHYGDWSAIQGKFKKERSQKGKDYVVPTWTDADAIKGGCGVTVSARVIGEDEPRTINFDLVQAQPRNSTLWATDARTQICYAAVRRFASIAAPALFMGVPFDRDDWDSAAEQARDITPGVREDAPPAPKRSDFTDEPRAKDYPVVTADGEIVSSFPAAGFVRTFANLIQAAIDENGDVQSLWEKNYDTFDKVREENPNLDIRDLVVRYNTWNAGQGEAEGDGSVEEKTVEAESAQPEAAPRKPTVVAAATPDPSLMFPGHPRPVIPKGGYGKDVHASRRDNLINKVLDCGEAGAVDAVLSEYRTVTDMLRQDKPAYYTAVQDAAAAHKKYLGG